MSEPTRAGATAQSIVERLQSKVRGADEDMPPERPEWEHRWEASIPRRFQHAGIELLDGAVAAEVAGWLNPDAAPSTNLILLGPVGTGKTFVGIAAMKHLARCGASFAFYPVVELLDRLRPGGDGDALLDRLCSVRVLMLDDLGAEKGSEWTAERLYLIVNRRWLEGRPTIVTSNLPAGELEVALDPRLYSRLVDGACALRLAGADRRRG